MKRRWWGTRSSKGQILMLAVAALLSLALVAPAASLSSPPSNAFRFLHDPDGRLRAAIDPEGDTATYSWDAAGNLLSISRHASSALSILQLSPSRGAVGETVVVQGTGFSSTPSANTVKFNGVAAKVEAATSWALNVVVPLGATSGPLTVSSGEEGPVSHEFTVASASKPSIASLEPIVVEEGDDVTVAGANFDGSVPGNVVTLNSQRAAVLSASSSAIHFEAPPDRLGGRVSVATAEGTAVGPDLFVPPGKVEAAAVNSTGRFTLGGSKGIALTSGKVGLLLFDGVAGESVSLVLSGATLGGSVSVWSPNGTQLGSTTYFSKGGASAVAGPFTLPESGTYTVLSGPTEAGTGTVTMTSYGFQHVTGSIVPSLEGAQRSVSLPIPGQEARYAIAGTVGQGISLKTTNSAFSGNYDLKLLNPAGQVVKSWTHTGAQNSLHEAVGFSTNGTYTLVVDPISTSTGTVDLTVWDGIYDAGSISPTSGGAVQTLPLKVPGGNTKVTFSGTAGQKVLFNFSEITFSGFVGIHKPGGGPFAGSEGSLPKGGSRLLEMTLPETGTYTLWLIQGSSNGETGNVKATAYAPPADLTGTIAPSEEGAQKSPSLSSIGQDARYTVSATAGQAASVKTSSSAFSGPYKLEWLNPAGQVIKNWTHTGTQNVLREAVTFPTTGNYTLVVNPEGTATGSATLTVWDATTYDAGTITPTSEGASKTLPLKVPNGTTMATFSGTAGQKVLFNFTEITFNGFVGIHKPGGGAFTGSEGSLSKGGSRLLEMTLPSTGTYTLYLIPTSGETGSVKATAYAPPADLTGSIAPSEEGAQKSVAISSPGQDARYTVSATAGQAASLKTTSSSFSGPYKLEWLNPSGGVIKSWTNTGSQNVFREAASFPTTGTYTLVVNPEGAATGSVTLTVWDASLYDAGTITPTSEGSSKTLPLKVPGATTKATFSGTAGQKLKFEFTEITFNAYVAIHSPKAKAISGGEASLPKGGSKTLTPASLPETGTYTIWFVPASANGETGSAKLTSYLEPTIAWPLLSGSTAMLVARHGPPRTDVYSDIPASDTGNSAPSTSEEKGGRAPVGLSPATPVDTGDPAWLPRGIRTWHPKKRGAWLPPRSSFERGWVVGQAAGPWAKVVPLQAATGTTAVSGQVLKVDGLPLAGARISVKGTSRATTTDVAGRFLLTDVPSGHQILVINGEATPARQRYGSFEAGVDLSPHKTTVLDYTTWMTPLDRGGDHAIASPTRRETRVTTPRIPGFEVRIPAGTVIRNAAGRPVKHLNITAIPVNRSAFPLPPFLSVPLYFTVQPGRAYLSKGARVIYPNWGNLPPGQRVDFWNYDPADQGWHVYGRGEVTPDGRQVVPDPGVRVWQFTGAMVVSSPPPPGEAPGADGASGGDPVDLYTGLFTYHKTDLVLPDTIPIKVERTYRPKDSNSYSFGRGMTSIYDLRLWSTNSEKEADLILPDGGRVHFVRTSPGSGETDAVFEADRSPGPFSKAKITYVPQGFGWELKLTDGTTYIFDPFVLAPLREIRDRYGNRLEFTRSDENIIEITSPHGRWVKFQYDSSNRITEAVDNGGRHFKYTYTSGGLTKVEAPEGRTTKYEYDESDRMKAIVNPRGNKYLQIAYDANGRVEEQTAGDGAAFDFAYALDESGEVETTTVTDPLGNQREVEFNTDGYPTSETEAPGTALERTTSFERQPETGLVLSETDPLGHETAFDYDGSGNLTEVTTLAGTEEAASSKFKYVAGTDRLAEATDPLGHTTKYEYGPEGELVKKTDPLGHETTIQYNGDGQPTAVTNPEGEETKLAYGNGDLVSLTDPLGRTTSRFLDALGRVRAVVSPGGQRMLLSYNAAGQTVSVKSPSGAETAIEYDADGNPTSLTDPRGNETTFDYDVMDRLVSETDALEQAAEWSYDKAGDVVEAVDRNGMVATFSYDQLRRMTSARYGVTGLTAESSIGYAYDLDNRVTDVTDTASGEYVFERDPLGRIESLEGPGGTVSYTYDAAGRRESMLIPGQEPLYYGYDAADRLTELSRGTEAVALDYDKAGRTSGITLPNGITQEYGYDAAGQTTSIAYKDGATTLGEIDYAYDANGREEAMWGSFARLALPEALNTAEYDADNRLVKRGAVELDYDKDGNLLSDGGSEYAWNARGQLTGISGEASASFAYDPFGRRVSKTLGGTTTDLLFDGANVALESKEGEATAALLTGLRADQLFARATESGTDSYLTDRLGSTVALADEEGEVTTSYTYEPFGQPTPAGPSSDNPYQFTGRETDGTGLQYNRARYYDFGAGRFISQDPAGFGGSDANLYWYIADDPLAFTDPTGECFMVCVPNPFESIEESLDQIGDWVSSAESVVSDAWAATKGYLSSCVTSGFYGAIMGAGIGVTAGGAGAVPGVITGGLSGCAEGVVTHGLDDLGYYTYSDIIEYGAGIRNFYRLGLNVHAEYPFIWQGLRDLGSVFT